MYEIEVKALLTAIETNKQKKTDPKKVVNKKGKVLRVCSYKPIDINPGPF